MKQEIRKNNKNLTIKLSVPLKTRRHNPYDESEIAETLPHLPERSEGREMNEVQRTSPRPASHGSVNDEMDNVVGVVAGDEIGFAYWLDRRYKGKGDDVSAPFYLYQGSLDDFRNLCKELNIAIVEYPTCAYCYKPIFGSFGFDEKGNKCFDCEKAT